MGDLGSWDEADGGLGLDAGDEICRTLAGDAGLPAPETFDAWLSHDTVNAIDRLANDGPWIRLDGVRIAENKAALTDGLLDATLNLTELGEYLGPRDAWTGTGSAGTVLAGFHCDRWRDGTDSFDGASGTANNIQSWTSGRVRDCDFPVGRLGEL